jgi:hypothetical protein
MSNPLQRLTMVVVLAVAGLVTAANAQKTPQAPEAAKPEITNPGNGSSASLANGGINPQNWPEGWNYVHATNCKMYNSGGSTFLVLYPQEGGYFYTVYAPFQSLISAACQTNHWLAFYVYDNNGDWDYLYTYDYS